MQYEQAGYNSFHLLLLAHIYLPASSKALQKFSSSIYSCVFSSCLIWSRSLQTFKCLQKLWYFCIEAIIEPSLIFLVWKRSWPYFFPLLCFLFQICWTLMKLVIIESIRASNHTQGLDWTVLSMCQGFITRIWILMSDSAEAVTRDSNVQVVYSRNHSMLNIKQRS